MKIFIERLSKKPVTTKYGQKMNLSVLDKNTQKWIGGFYRSEMSGWCEGMEIEAPVVRKGEYLNFAFPKEGSGHIGQSTGASVNTGEINKKLDQIIGLLQGHGLDPYKGEQNTGHTHPETPYAGDPFPTDEDMPQDEPVEGIPF